MSYLIDGGRWPPFFSTTFFRMKYGLNKLFPAFCVVAFATEAVSANLESIRIGLTHDASSGPMYIAVAKGYFADEGLDPQLRFFNSDAFVPSRVASGELDFGVTSLTASFFSFAAQHGLRLFASQNSDQAGFSGNALAVSKKSYDAGLRNWKDLAGKRVGLPAAGSGLHYALAQIAKKYRVDLRDTRLVWFPTPSKEVAALSHGQIDAALLPAATARQFRPSRMSIISSRVGDEISWQESVIFTRAQTIHDSRPLVEKFVRAYQRGAAEYDQTFLQRADGGSVIKGPNYDAYLALIARRANMSADILETGMPWCDRLARLYVTDIENQLKFWQGRGMVDPSVSAAELLDLSFIAEHIEALR